MVQQPVDGRGVITGSGGLGGQSTARRLGTAGVDAVLAHVVGRARTSERDPSRAP